MTLAVVALAVIAPAVSNDAPCQGNSSALESAFATAVVDSLIAEADVHWHRGDYGRAARAELLATDLEPSYIDGYTNAAWLAWSWAASMQAQAICERLIARNPNSPDAFFEAATQCKLRGDLGRAELLYRRAHELEPDSRLTMAELAGLLRRRGAWAEAADVYRKILELYPNDEPALRYLQRYEATGTMERPDAGPPPPQRGGPRAVPRMVLPRGQRA